MENPKIDNEHILNLYLGINGKNNHLMQADYDIVSLPFAPNQSSEAKKDIEQKAKIHFQQFKERFLETHKFHQAIENLIFKHYQFKNSDMNIFPKWDLQKLDQTYIRSYIYPFVELNNIVPIEVVPFLNKRESMEIDQELLNNSNAEQLIRKYSNIPAVIRNIVKVLGKDPTQITENKANILDALNNTSYIKSLQDFHIPILTNLHLLISHLKSTNTSDYHQLKDLISFQEAKNLYERIRLISAYQHQPEITKKQIEICTLINEKISSPYELFKAFQNTDYFKQNYFKSIIHQGPQPYHLILTGQKIFYANNIIYQIKDGFHVNLDTYWILQEDALKDKIAINIALTKHYPLNRGLMQHILSELQADIDVCIRKKFHGIDSFIEDIEMLTSKYKEDIPQEIISEKIIGPQNISFDIENLSKLQFERSHLHKMVCDLAKDTVSDTILTYGWENSPFWSQINASIDKSIFYCPILEPIFHCTINLLDKKKYIDKSLLKDFVEEYLTALGYIGNSFIISSDPIYHSLDIYTLNFIQNNTGYHPVCTVNHYANSKKILYELERKYVHIECPQKKCVEKFLKDQNPANKNSPENEKGMKL